MIDNYNSLAEKFIRKGLWLYVFSFIIGPIGYIIKIIISGELSVDEVGVLYGIISLVTLIGAYNDLGMTESLKYYLPKYVTEKNYSKAKSIIFYALFAQIFSSIIIFCIFWFGADFLAENYFKNDQAIGVLKIFAFFFVGINIFQTINNFFIAVQDTFSHKITEFFRMIFIAIFVLSIFFIDAGSLVNYSFGWLFGLYIGILITLFIFYKKYYKTYFAGESIIIDKQEIKKISKYAFMVFLGAGAATILSQIDMQMIIYMLGTTDAGYYTNYLSIIGIPFLIITPIFALLFPIFSEFHSKGDYSKIIIVKNIFAKNFLNIGIMFNIFFFIFAEVLAFTLFGEKFITSGIILKYSILLLIFNFMMQINFNIMAGIGKVKQRVQIIVIAIFFNFFMNFILINLLGVFGAALATGLGWLLIWILSEIFLGKKYAIKFDFLSIGKNLFILGICGLIINTFIIQFFDNFNRIISFFMLGLVFAVWLVIFTAINKNDFIFFVKEIKKLKKKKTS